VKSHILVPLAVCLLVPCCKKTDAPPDGTTATGNAAAAAPAFALGNFEGQVELLAKSSEEPKPIPPLTLSVKGGMFRMDLPEGMTKGRDLGNKGYMVINPKDKKVFIVSDEQKQAISFDLANLSERLKSFKPPTSPQAAPGAATGTPPKVVKTGTSDTVAGRSCENWDITSQNGEHARVCVASEGVSWLNLPSLNLSGEQAWMTELFDGQHVPLRFVGYKKDGTEDGRLEVEKIDPKPLADTLFQVPAGYRIMDMDQMMKAFGGLPGGMPGMGAPGMGAPGTMPALPPNLKLPPGVAEEMAKRMREHMPPAQAPH
jgi:hypothetical protein